jgi:GntR family transcriptional regulator/MocR family aminotransferase
MRPWAFPVPLSPDSSEPLFLQITQAVSWAIQSGRLKPGALLPGSRTLAQNLGVHRNTVLAAYRELAAEGWIQSLGRATWVMPDVPAVVAPGLGKADRPGYDLPPLPRAWDLSPPTRDLTFGGIPDPDLFPIRDLGQAFRRALRKRSLLDRGDARGNAPLREGLSGLLSETRGITVSPEQIVITGGSQMALELISRSLIRPGDRVVVEDPGYPAAWATFRHAGATLIPVSVDREGLRVDLLEALAEEGRVRAVFITPHHQYPTTVTMSATRRLRLLELAARHRIAIVEDDYDFDFHFVGHPVMPLASRDPWGVVIYVGTLSKVLAPGLRLGFVAAPAALAEAIAFHRQMLDQNGNQVMEQAVADLLAEGLLQRHVRKMRRVYASRREALAQALRRHLDGTLAFDLPSGGMCIWARTGPGVDLEDWSDRARSRGLELRPGRAFDFHGQPRGGLRLGFSHLSEDNARRAVRIMAETLRRS